MFFDGCMITSYLALLLLGIGTISLIGLAFKAIAGQEIGIQQKEILGTIIIAGLVVGLTMLVFLEINGLWMRTCH